MMDIPMNSELLKQLIEACVKLGYHFATHKKPVEEAQVLAVNCFNEGAFESTGIRNTL